MRLTVFSILGQEVRRLVDEPLPAGNHVVTWDASDSAREPVSSGVYFYRFETEQFSAARKMLLLK